MTTVRFLDSGWVYRTAHEDWEVFVRGRAWVRVSELREGDRVHHPSGAGYLVVSNVEREPKTRYERV